ncbi:hypothetical protein MKW92_015788 [Papaver armeniacum]|nr:hypothetical protein MKW92_015788 [Papaver armeniacum]
MQTNKVRFNVGGKIFETTTTTLANAGRNSVFGAMFDEQWNLQPREIEEEYFVDRDPECFSVLLNLLRTGKLHVPPNIPEKLLYEEALYYGLLDNVRTAKWGRLVGNQLNLTSSVRGRAPHGWSAIRASPDGGCVVAHGRMVHIYNWMLEEHAPLDLDYGEVNDIGWIDSENIVVSTGRISGQEGGAMGLFSSSTGDLRHRYEVKRQTAGALCFNSDSKIFSSCTDGIGVWDQVTGTQTDFFNSPPGWALGGADKIQWLNGSNCLLAFYIRRTNDRRIHLLDFREKNIVWTWSNLVHTREKNSIYDAIAVEQSNSICVASDYEGLGFMDLRSTVGSIRWNPRTNKNHAHHDFYPKLSLHGRHVFYSSYGNISVFSGPDYSILTSRLGRSCGGSICDFSIGGDRLFAIHSEENVFDVWETPSPAII